MANISDGEIYWIKENVDTITVKCLGNNESHITYEINESKNVWMKMLYEEELFHLIKEEISFPKIKYIKNKITKEGVFPDSCQLSEFTIKHLSNRIKLYKEGGNYVHVKKFEDLIQKIDNCNVNKYNYLYQSRNLLALDNYITSANSDTLKYEITQLEHLGIKTRIAAFNSENQEGNKVIHLIQYEYQEENEQSWNKIIEMNKEKLDEKQIKSFIKIRDSIKSCNRATIELDENLKVIKYFSRVDRRYINRSNQEQFRFYNYEIRKIAY